MGSGESRRGRRSRERYKRPRPRFSPTCSPLEVRDGAAVPEPGPGNRSGTHGLSSVAPPGSGRRCPRAKFGGFEESSPGRPPCPCLKDRGDIFTPQTAAPLSPPAPIALI